MYQDKIRELTNLKRSLSANKNKDKSTDTILELSSRTASKVVQKMLDDPTLNFGCSNCGWNDTVGDIHHINGRKIENADDPSNLSYLCPNCHRKAHKGLILKKDLITFKEQVGDAWKKYCPSVKGKNDYQKKIAKINSEIKILIKYENLEKLKSSDIDFTKIGWVNDASKIINVTPQKVGSWLNRIDPEFYSKCYKRKN